MRQMVLSGWNFIFNAEVSPLRHIKDVSLRHYVLQALGFMWAAASSVALGSYTLGFASIIGHTVLIGAAAITVATYTTATLKPDFFSSNSGRRRDGEHEQMPAVSPGVRLYRVVSAPRRYTVRVR